MTKSMIMNLVALFLFLVSFTAFADKFVIAGKPVVLNVHPGYFTFPTTYTDIQMGYNSKGYYFVTISGVNRVCYLTKKPELMQLDTIKIVIEKDGVKLPWNCYKYDSRFFYINF